MLGKFSENKQISYYMTDNKLKLKISSLTELLQDIAIDNSDNLGYTISYLGSINKAWIISNWHIVIDSMPKYGDKICLETWASACRGFQAERSYDVISQSGETVIRVSSRWIVLDMKKRSIERIPSNVAEDYKSGIGPAIENEKYRMPKPEGEPMSIFEAAVMRSQTDSNGHANNTQYIAWAIDMVPQKIYDNYRCFDVRVVYRKESYMNDKVKAKTYLKNENGVKELITMIVNADNEEEIHCEIATLWRE
ncbi:MAG: thioesterase [Clostridia bacterium]|jgi:acyl-ACP thioesterase|nr:thioesterase [Clostridia bacterium]